MLKYFSLTTIFTGIFFAFILRSIYSLYGIFEAPQCNVGDICYHYYLNQNPELDLLVYVSDNSRSGNFDLVLHEGKFEYREPYEREIEIELSNHVRHNGTLFIHTLLLPARNKKYSINSINNLISAPDSTYVKGRLSIFAVPKSDTFNLLKSKESKKEREIVQQPVSHLRSKYAVRMCTEELHIPHREVPIEILRQFRVTQQSTILPIMVEDALSMRLKDLELIGANNKFMKFKYIYNPSSLGKLRFLAQMDLSFKEFVKLGFTEKDTDEVKSIFADTNVYLLCATMAIASVHLLLDFLSFKNDVSFWKNKKTMAGLSSRVVLWRAFSQCVVFLYLLDEQTSALVLIPSGIGTFIEFWKVSKMFKTRIQFTWTGPRFRNDIKESKEEEETRKYDAESMRYLSWVLYPLCIGAAVYSLMYQPHKSWYSWTINSLVNGVYAFGFLFMLPQLFINYRLKSVAALPWRAFMYRAFNTFIDDIFAFIITMPMAHRVACFRDDVIFLIYLYQRWLYPVDRSRTEGVNGEISNKADNKPSNEEKKKQ